MNSDHVVSLPLIHKHLMMPWNSLEEGHCCGRFEDIDDGYYCRICDIFVHKKCGDEAPESIQHPSDPGHTLRLQSDPHHDCNVCTKKIVDLLYRCEICDFEIDLHCAKHPLPDVPDTSGMHDHKLTLYNDHSVFYCHANCSWNGEHGFSFKCDRCELFFHLDCLRKNQEANSQLEINHSHHTLHLLKLLKGPPPEYSDGKCRLCERNVGNIYYHCSSCNFTLDMHCVSYPPQQSLNNLTAHDHQLTLLPRHRSFICNACGLEGDRSPYICVQCDFIIHQGCVGLPRLININRHDHRVSRTSVLGVVNSVCGVCRKKVDWTCGGYLCQRCSSYVVHSKCATRKDVWNGKELEGVPEEKESIEPYKVIDDNTINHFSHKNHNLKLHVNGVLYEESKRCSACTHPIGLQSFYGCCDCSFILHQSCANFPKRKWHVLHSEQLTLVTSDGGFFVCDACGRPSNGFMYKHGYKKLDVRCSSITEPFLHPSHPHHPLYYIPPHEEEVCNGCNKMESHVLRCIEDGCGFVLGFKCATLPQVVKHRVDDHPLSLCYGDEEANRKYWCDICEKETSPRTWFYTCKDHRASLHIKCVLGDFSGLMPRTTTKVFDSKSYEVVLNNSVVRPFCSWCKSRCLYPIILKLFGTSSTYFCDLKCAWWAD